MLLGTNCLMSILTVGNTQVQLGTVVSRAFADSGLCEIDWNDLPEEDRDIRLVRAYYEMRRKDALMEKALKLSHVASLKE
jgi:hypothetical protein